MCIHVSSQAQLVERKNKTFAQKLFNPHSHELVTGNRNTNVTLSITFSRLIFEKIYKTKHYVKEKWIINKINNFKSKRKLETFNFGFYGKN